MSLLDILRSGVAIANTVTRSLQAYVTYSRYVENVDGFGTPGYPTSVQLHAIVDWKQRQVRTAAGILSVSRASILFIDIAELSAATGGAGIDDNDRIVLPDGTTGPILDMAGFIDAGTGHPIATEVFIG